MRLLSCCLLIAPLLLACGKSDSKQAAPAPSSQAQKVDWKAVSPQVAHGISWYMDAPEAAFARAAAEHKLVFVDLWAAWCHTCKSMREFVLTDKNLAGVSERLVFLALDTEKASNAAQLKRFPIAAWPTFFLAGGDGKIYGRWVGAGSAQQISQFARDGLRAYDAQKSAPFAPNDPLALLVEGDRLAASEKLLEARDHYQRALSAAAQDWPRRPDALVALSATFRRLAQAHACVDLGLNALDHTGESASATDFAYNVVDCADMLEKDDPRRPELFKAAERKLSKLCNDGAASLTPDDRGDACGVLQSVRLRLGDADGVKAAVQKRLEVLEAAAAGLPDALAVTYDFARVESLVALGRGEEAIRLLTEREKALPDDYNPPHYLALTYGDMGRYGEGLSAIERALSKASAQAQGPRRAAMLGAKADLLASTGHTNLTKRVLQEQLAAYKALREGQKQPGREREIMTRIARFD